MKSQNDLTIITTNRFYSIDFLRGVAALCVLIFHTRGIAWVGITEWLSKGNSANTLDIVLGYSSIPFRYGYWGVPLLFVLSGYCIHQSTINSTQKTGFFSLPYYLKRRILRIYPVLFFSLILTGILDNLSKFISGEFPARDLTWASFFYTLLTLQNFLPPVYGSNNPLWSVAIEMHLYLIYPIIIYLSLQKKPILLFFITILTSATMIYFKEYSFLSYLWTWSCGVILCEHNINISKIIKENKSLLYFLIFICSSLLICCIIFETHFSTPIRYALLTPSCVAVILFFTNLENKGLLKKNQFIGTISFIGIFSYSLYATHEPFLYFLKSTIIGGHQSTYFFPVIIFSLASIIVSFLFFLLFENPFLSNSSRLTLLHVPNSSTIPEKNRT
jgi:peptidoglycan/LPS O-acetylase OafA/YrhL